MPPLQPNVSGENAVTSRNSSKILCLFYANCLSHVCLMIGLCNLFLMFYFSAVGLRRSGLYDCGKDQWRQQLVTNERDLMI
jgi:hypothetical protein